MWPQIIFTMWEQRHSETRTLTCELWVNDPEDNVTRDIKSTFKLHSLIATSVDKDMFLSSRVLAWF